MKPLTIQQMSEKTGLSAHALRYYEKIGLIRAVERDTSGYRQYSEADVGWVQFLLRLRETGMPISEMKKFSDLRSRGDSTTAFRLEMLQKHREKVETRIAALRGHLEKMDDKIEHYKSLI